MKGPRPSASLDLLLVDTIVAVTASLPTTPFGGAKQTGMCRLPLLLLCILLARRFLCLPKIKVDGGRWGGHAVRRCDRGQRQDRENEDVVFRATAVADSQAQEQDGVRRPQEHGLHLLHEQHAAAGLLSLLWSEMLLVLPPPPLLLLLPLLPLLPLLLLLLKRRAPFSRSCSYGLWRVVSGGGYFLFWAVGNGARSRRALCGRLVEYCLLF